jgi:hypothetical protein
MECAPAFNYARDSHTTEIVDDSSQPSTQRKKAVFESKDLKLDLRWTAGSTLDNVESPVVSLETLDLSSRGHLGPAVFSELILHEGQTISYILRSPPDEGQGPLSKTDTVLVHEGDNVVSRKIADPLLTQSLVSSILLVSLNPLTFPFYIMINSLWIYRLLASIGMTGFANLPMKVHGRKRFIVVLWH